MALPTAAKAAKLVKLAQEALQTLADSASTSADLLPRGKLFTVHEANGPVEKMQMRVLQRLEAAGAITSVRIDGARRGQPLLWGVNKPELVSALLADETKISAVLWPASSVVPVLEGEGASPSTLSYADMGSPPEPVEEAPEAADSLLQEAMLAVLKTVKGIGEGIAALNTRLDVIEKRLSNMPYAKEEHGS